MRTTNRAAVKNNRQLRSRFAQGFNVEEFLGDRKHCRGFSVRQGPLQGRTAHTKCGLYLLASSLAAALLGTRRVLARQGREGEKSGCFEQLPQEPAAVSKMIWLVSRWIQPQEPMADGL